MKDFWPSVVSLNAVVILALSCMGQAIAQETGVNEETQEDRLNRFLSSLRAGGRTFAGPAIFRGGTGSPSLGSPPNGNPVCTRSSSHSRMRKASG